MEGAYKHFFDSDEKNFPEGFFGGVLFFEQCGGVSEGPAFSGDDSGGGAGSDDCGGARVDRRDESGGGEGVVDSWGDRQK